MEDGVVVMLELQGLSVLLNFVSPRDDRQGSNEYSLREHPSRLELISIVPRYAVGSK